MPVRKVGALSMNGARLAQPQQRSNATEAFGFCQGARYFVAWCGWASRAPFGSGNASLPRLLRMRTHHEKNSTIGLSRHNGFFLLMAV